MKAKFREWLVGKGYSVITPNGAQSTVDDYPKRVEKVCEWENMTWSAIAEEIERIIQEYGDGGVKAEKGNMSHKAVINALRRFKEFCLECR